MEDSQRGFKKSYTVNSKIMQMGNSDGYLSTLGELSPVAVN